MTTNTTNTAATLDTMRDIRAQLRATADPRAAINYADPIQADALNYIPADDDTAPATVRDLIHALTDKINALYWDMQPNTAPDTTADTDPDAPAHTVHINVWGIATHYDADGNICGREETTPDSPAWYRAQGFNVTDDCYQSTTDPDTHTESDSTPHLWYAVMLDSDDDWGTGSHDRAEALEMLDSYHANGYPDAYICVVDVHTENPVAVDEITL